MMRNACGCNDHSDVTTFLQVFHLLSTYSLIKPPRGSNVTGSEMVRSLLDFNDLTPANNVQQELNNRLELLLRTGSKSVMIDNLEDQLFSAKFTWLCCWILGWLCCISRPKDVYT